MPCSCDGVFDMGESLQGGLCSLPCWHRPHAHMHARLHIRTRGLLNDADSKPMLRALCCHSQAATGPANNPPARAAKARVAPLKGVHAHRERPRPRRATRHWRWTPRRARSTARAGSAPALRARRARRPRLRFHGMSRVKTWHATVDAAVSPFYCKVSLSTRLSASTGYPGARIACSVKTFSESAEPGVGRCRCRAGTPMLRGPATCPAHGSRQRPAGGAARLAGAGRAAAVRGARRRRWRLRWRRRPRPG